MYLCVINAGNLLNLSVCLCAPVCMFNRAEHVAMKIIRNIDCFREVAKSEIAVLEEINSLDDNNCL